MQLPPPLLDRLADVEPGEIAVLPKNMCKCELFATPGNTMGSKKAIFVSLHVMRKLPSPSGALGLAPALAVLMILTPSSPRGTINVVAFRPASPTFGLSS